MSASVIMPSSVLKKLRILIVDDAPITLMALKHQITALGHEVVATATTGLEALAKHELHQPDLVLMDVKMPVMDGIEATRILQTRTPAPIVVIITAFDDKETIKRIKQAGAAAYLVKPSDDDKLRLVIRTVWEQTPENRGPASFTRFH